VSCFKPCGAMRSISGSLSSDSSCSGSCSINCRASGPARLDRLGVVATVNGRGHSADPSGPRATAQREQARSQQVGHPLSLDERQQLDQQTFDELVSNILIDQELERRHISVTDNDIIEAAQNRAAPELMDAPQLQTEGKFDPDKYRRFLSSPMAKQQGILVSLENMYRTQIPRQKLFEQIAMGVSSPMACSGACGGTRTTRRRSRSFASLQTPRRRPVRRSRCRRARILRTPKDDLTKRGHAVISLLILSRAATHSDFRSHARARGGLAAGHRARYEVRGRCQA